MAYADDDERKSARFAIQFTRLGRFTRFFLGQSKQCIDGCCRHAASTAPATDGDQRQIKSQGILLTFHDSDKADRHGNDQSRTACRPFALPSTKRSKPSGALPITYTASG